MNATQRRRRRAFREIMSWGTHYGVRTDWTAQDYADALSKAQGEELRALAAEVNERWGETP